MTAAKRAPVATPATELLEAVEQDTAGSRLPEPAPVQQPSSPPQEHTTNRSAIALPAARLHARHASATRPTTAAIMAVGALILIAALVLPRDASLRASPTTATPVETVSMSDDRGINQVGATVSRANDRERATPINDVPDQARRATDRESSIETDVTSVERRADKGRGAASSSRTEPSLPPPTAPASSAPLRPTAVTMVAKADEPTAASAAPVSPSPDAPESSAALTSAHQVSITGCLEASTEGNRFRLTDTEGDAAPKARGWKSGFLKKRAAAVELLDVPDQLASRKYVGHRVVATGTLADRELRVRSLRSAGEKCD